MPRSDSQLVDVQAVEPLDVLEAKVRVPAVPVGSVPRVPLLNRLRASDACSLVTVLAPAGYGKTTVLAEWAARDSRQFVWVTIGEEDDDPTTFSRSIATALARARLGDASTSGPVGSARPSASAAFRRLASALSAADEQFVLVLDDIHNLRSRSCVQAVAALAEHIPDGSTLALAGRVLPRLPIARARTSGRLLEIGVDELALTRREVELLLRAVDVDYEAEDVAELTSRTEGWPVGAYLAALALKEGAANRAASPSVGGDDRFVADYFDFEHLSRLAPKDIRFLTRTAVLERMCGPLCDALLESGGSAARLESLARANLFVVRLDRQRRWYRYHHEFREFLRAELERREPQLVPDLHRRAAAWYEASGAPEDAIPHARAAGDLDALARLVCGLALVACSSGRPETVESWLHSFDELELERYPVVGVLGAWVHLLRGRPAAAKRWLDAAESGAAVSRAPDGSRSLEPWIALLRAAMCSDGVEQMRADAELALRQLGPSSRWRPTALLLRGVAQVLLGDVAGGDESLAEAAEAAEDLDAPGVRLVALAERCLLAEAREETTGADRLAQEARDLIGERSLGEEAMSALAFAVCARQSLRRGDLARARAELATARSLARQATYAMPWHAVQTTLELARADLAQLDPQGARTWLAAGEEILRRRPRLGNLAAQSSALHIEADRVAALCEGRAAGLTSAELRLLPLLSTHLSFREIADRFFVSRNTVKTQAISVYRKLNASSRSEAMARAIDLGLVDPALASGPSAFTPSG